MDSDTLEFDIPGILECQNNRYPMLFLDRVTECVPGQYAKGYKLFSYNEWYFHGYDTTDPKVWNVIQIEAMSQLFLMTFLSKEEFKGSIAVSNKFEEANFYKKIIPGDRLDLEATLTSFGRGVAKGTVVGSVKGEQACSISCTIIVPELFEQFKPQAMKPKEKNEQNKSIPASRPDNPNLDFGIPKIKECLLNKHPWLFIDRVTDIVPGEFARAVKNYTYNEPYFPEHFPNNPSVPGFIQIETCMQAFLMTFLSLEKFKRKETADRRLSNISIKRKIIPGDTMEISAYLDNFSRGIAKGRVESFVDREPAVSFEVVVVIPEEIDKFMPKK